MRPQWQGCLNQRNLKPSRRDWLKLLLYGFALMAMTATAAPIINSGNPVCFFTNVASRLLSTELNVNLTQIEIYPTNQFTPAVHRLLQVAANIYDASTNRYYDPVPSTNTIALPTVFQPVFGVENGYVYITNFIEVTNLNVFNNTIRNLNYGPSVVAALQPDDLVFGVPLIIGAKKGFPNFNEFFMENTFQLTRKLLVTRTDTNATVTLNPSFFNYYEQFDLSLSNHFGVEMWNSYRSNYTRPTDIYVTNYITMTLTNDEDNFIFANNLVASGYLHFDSTTPWPAYNAFSPTSSFQIPLATNFPAVPSSIYLFNSFTPPQLTTNLAVPFQTNYPSTYGLFPQPYWGMTITNNLQVTVVDSISGRLIDYVQLSGPNGSRDLSAEIQNGYVRLGTDTGYNNLWNTNLAAGGVPVGILDQIIVSSGAGNPIYSANLWGQSQKSAYDQINAFRIFTMGKNAGLLNYPGYVADPTQIGIAATTNAIQAPYTPTATVVQDIAWQANDPLVHYLASDLINPALGNGLGITVKWPANLRLLNPRYTPWGGNPLLPGSDLNPYNLAIKDPLVYSSDYWNFPDGQPLNPDWIGQVHRGTPWQTLYLKASDIIGTSGINTWINWTGDLDTNDAAAMAPVQDRHLASLLASLFNTNNLASLFSVNNPAPNAWQGLLDGLTGSMNIPAQFDSVLISSNSSQASAIANAIESERVSKPGQFFSDVGDILATPQLVEQSPFLAGASSNIVSDADYEIIPSQLLSLLRADSVGSVALINSQPLVQFTGYDGHPYAIQMSSNLVNWVSISTNFPANGVLIYKNSMMPNANQEFYRSVLLQ
jgi:hypothetical protein